MNDKKGNLHNLESIYFIDMEDNEMYYLAPSLEEYLIGKTKNKILLLNGIGNVI